MKAINLFMTVVIASILSACPLTDGVSVNSNLARAKSKATYTLKFKSDIGNQVRGELFDVSPVLEISSSRSGDDFSSLANATIDVALKDGTSDLQGTTSVKVESSTVTFANLKITTTGTKSFIATLSTDNSVAVESNAFNVTTSSSSSTSTSSSSGSSSSSTSSVFVDPTSISGMRLWLKASTISGNNNDQISIWTDSSSNAYVFTPSSASNKPILKTTIMNGRPGVAFSQVSEAYKNLRNTSFIQAQPMTVVAVTQAASGVAIQFLFDGITQRIAAFCNWPTASGLTIWAGDAGGGSAGYVGVSATNSPKVLIMEYAGGNGRAWIHSTTASSTVPVGSNTLDGLVLGSSYGITAAGFTYLGDFAIYSGTLTDTDRSNLMTYFKNLYGI